MDPIERLVALLTAARRWPIAQEYRLRERLALWIAFRESQIEVLRRAARWKADRQYVIDNLPQKIAEAYGSLMFGSDPEVKAGNKSDQDRLKGSIWDGNAAPSGLQAAEETCVSEGEVWWRGSRNVLVPHPILTWHSRYDVVPLLHGREVLAVAFVTRYSDPRAGDKQTVWRHLEVHGPGRVANLLFRGRDGALGDVVPLDRHAQTADLPEVWDHGLPMLAGRIVNRWGRDPLAGVSIYEGIWRQFLVLNEATTIGRENLRLTAKKRVVLPASAARPSSAEPEPLDGQAFDPDRRRQARAQVDVDEEIIFDDPLDTTEGRESGSNHFKVLEYSFDAEALIAYCEHLISTIAQRCDLVPQFMGRGDFGSASSGTALRVRLLPTVNAIEGRARSWDDDLPVVFNRLQQLDAAPVTVAGLAAPWTDAAATPSIERDATLPEDPGDQAQRLATLRTGALISIEEGVREQHHDWEPDEVTAEVERIHADERATLPSATLGNPTPPGEGEPPAGEGT